MTIVTQPGVIIERESVQPALAECGCHAGREPATELVTNWWLCTVAQDPELERIALAALGAAARDALPALRGGGSGFGGGGAGRTQSSVGGTLALPPAQVHQARRL